jgi:hypothetical protein
MHDALCHALLWSFFCLLLCLTAITQVALHNPGYLSRHSRSSRTRFGLISLVRTFDRALASLSLPSRLSVFTRRNVNAPYTALHIVRIEAVSATPAGQRVVPLLDYEDMPFWQRIRFGHRRNAYKSLFIIESLQDFSLRAGINVLGRHYKRLMPIFVRSCVQMIAERYPGIPYARVRVVMSNGASLSVDLEQFSS